MNIEFFSEYKCPFCLKMAFAVLLDNLKIPVQNETEIIWEDGGSPKITKLIETYGNVVPFPTLMKDGEVREAVNGVYGNLNDNLILLNSLMEEELWKTKL